MQFWREEWALLRLVWGEPVFWLWWPALGLWAVAAGLIDPLGGPFLPQLLVALLAGILVAVAWIDHKTQLIPLTLSVGLGVSGVLWHGVGGTLMVSFWGLLVAGGAMLALGWSAQMLLKREALGLGDVVLVAGLGAWLGMAGLPPLLAFTALIGLVVVGGRVLGGAGREAFAFGPILALAGWLALLYGHYYWAFVLPHAAG
jgi:leader peptidase (prepilin peptidase)/N-methyltransferase